MEPWLAANLSWSLPGLGQFYAGRRTEGILFLALELGLWTAYFLWLLIPEVPFAVLAVAFFGFLALWILSTAHAYRATRRHEVSETPEKSPWLALFLARFIPGLGH